MKRFKGEPFKEKYEKSSGAQSNKTLYATPTVMEYSPDGSFLVVGYDIGRIYVYNPENVHEKTQDSKISITDIIEDEKCSPIQEILFSIDAKHFAACDQKGRLGVFKHDSMIKEKSTKEWHRIAENDFSQTIISFCFSEKNHKVYCICVDKQIKLQNEINPSQ